MKPCNGEKPPFSSSSRSQYWRGLSSQESQSREAALSSAARSGSASRSINSPPCGSMRWLGLAGPSAARSRSGAGTGNTETLVIEFLIRSSQIQGNYGPGEAAGDDREPALPRGGDGAARCQRCGARRQTGQDRALRPRRGRLRFFAAGAFDDDAGAEESGRDDHGLALPPGDHARPARVVRTPDPLRIDTGDDAVAFESHHLFALLLGRGLADRQVAGDAELLLIELHLAIVGDFDHLALGTGDDLAGRVDEGRVHLHLLIALLWPA